MVSRPSSELPPSSSSGAIYVHLRSGAIDELRPADAVQVAGESIVILHGNAPVARYRGSDIVLCTHADISPIPFC